MIKSNFSGELIYHQSFLLFIFQINVHQRNIPQMTLQLLEKDDIL